MLRTNLFKTVDRAETRFIAVRDSITAPNETIDIETMDAIHCRRGRLGVGWHFVITVSGNIQLGRDIETCGSHTRDLDTVSVSIGVIGGADEDGVRMNTRTPEQIEALSDLIDFLTDRYPGAKVSDSPDP